VRVAIVLAAVCGLAFLVVSRVEPGRARQVDRAPAVAVRDPRPRRPRVAHRGPQFVVVSFDGSGGIRLWPYWRAVARRAHAHFTFFVSGVYLLPEAQRRRYQGPRHRAGVSDIWFARPDLGLSAGQVVRRTLAEIAGAYREGHEIGTHFNGHFCEPYAGNVDEWSAADWSRELDQFDRLLFRMPGALPFGPREIVGERTPCLQGRLPVLYRVLARRGFRYDASALAPLGSWPRRRLGIWSVPLLEVPFPGHSYRVVSMDYNLFANQTGGVSGSRSLEPRIERETYLTLRRAFRTSYRGNRAPFVYASHFETWNHWAYDRALTRFLLETCGLPDARCVSYRELVGWLDARTSGRASAPKRRTRSSSPSRS
jgi:peptidoglycan/xylan/chitin deacetylase (PgdA/CDA1 family)